MKQGKTGNMAGWWWCLLLIPGPRKQRHEDLLEFKVSQSHIEKPCLEYIHGEKNGSAVQSYGDF